MGERERQKNGQKIKCVESIWKYCCFKHDATHVVNYILFLDESTNTLCVHNFISHEKYHKMRKSSLPRGVTTLNFVMHSPAYSRSL